MELMSLLGALDWLSQRQAPSLILMDSVYVLKGATEWRHGWRRRDWKTSEGQPVANRDLWEELDKKLPKIKYIEFGYVAGHSGVPGNDRADQIAVAFSRGESPNLYKGEIENYSWNVRELPPSTKIPELKYGNGEKKQVYSYLSNIGGDVYRHKTWSSCEARVKGQSRARFKKAMSQAEEIQILSEWGVDPQTVKGE